MATYHDLPASIRGIGTRIRERRDWAARRRPDPADAPMRLPSGLCRGCGAAADGRLTSQAAVPGRQWPADDVTRSGTAKTGYLSARRAVTGGTHSGHNAVGPPTGADLHPTGISDTDRAPDGRRHDHPLIDAASIRTPIPLHKGAHP